MVRPDERDERQPGQVGGDDGRVDGRGRRRRSPGRRGSRRGGWAARSAATRRVSVSGRPVAIEQAMTSAGSVNSTPASAGPRARTSIVSSSTRTLTWPSTSSISPAWARMRHATATRRRSAVRRVGSTGRASVGAPGRRPRRGVPAGGANCQWIPARSGRFALTVRDPGGEVRDRSEGPRGPDQGAGSLVGRVRVPDQPRDARRPGAGVGPLAPLRRGLRGGGRAGRLRLPHPADDGGRRRVQARRRGHGRRVQGDVRVHRPRWPPRRPAPGAHRQRLPGVRAAPSDDAVEGVVRRAQLPLREAAARPLPPVRPGRGRGARRRRPVPRRRGHRPRLALLRGARAAPGDAARQLARRAGGPRPLRRRPRTPTSARTSTPSRRRAARRWSATRCACSTPSGRPTPT